MPELPEVETVRRGLEASVLGRRVARAEVLGRRSVRRQSAAEFAAALEGRKLVSAGRYGKYLLAGLDDGASLVAHLRMSGQLLFVEAAAPAEPAGTDAPEPRTAGRPVPPAAVQGAPGEPPGGEGLPPHTHVRILFEDGSELRFVDQRTFGELFVTADHDELGRPAALAGLGPDPIVDGLPASRLRAVLAGRRAPVKAVLLDQRAIAGIGNIYADEILHRARIRPDRPAGSLSPAAVRRLAEAIGEVLAEAVERRGSSLRDARYRDLMGAPGEYQLAHAVYGRTGEPCPSCGRPVVQIRLAGRSAHFCRRCQR